jgi:Lhr-like helicase
MKTEVTGAVPVLHIDGKDYSLIKSDRQYAFYDADDTLIVRITASGIKDMWTVHTVNGRVGNVHHERAVWSLYEGPIRTRHRFTFGQDNTMIKVAEVIIKKEIRNG